MDVTDSLGDKTSESYTLNVCPPTVPGINLCVDDAGDPLAQGTAGVPYSEVLNAAGGNGDYTYEVPASVDGLSLFQTGDTITLSGTPALAGTFSFTISTQDGAGDTGNQSFALDVGLGLVPGLLPSPGNMLAPGLVNDPYQQVITAMGGTGSLTYTYSPSTLDGVNLTEQGGVLVLAGTPTAAGQFTFSVSVQDGAEHQVSLGYTLDVAAAPVTLDIQTATGGTTVSPTALLPAEVNQPYSQTIEISGGSGDYHLTKDTSLPPTFYGLSFAHSGDTVTISGTPTQAGSFTYLLSYIDDYGLSNFTQQYTITVGASTSDLSLVANGSPDLPAASENVPYIQTFAAFNGTSAYTFSTDQGTTLPTGLTFTASGSDYVLSGTPTQAGTFPLVITVQSGTQSVTESYSLTIDPPAPLTLTRESMPAGMQGFAFIQNLVNDADSAASGPSILWNPYPYDITASGGSGTGYEFTATGLPPGMNCSATGQIGGTPTATGDFTVTVTVSDSAGNTANATYDLSITPSPPFTGDPFDYFSSVTFPSQMVNEAYGYNNIILSGGVIGTGAGQTIAVMKKI